MKDAAVVERTAALARRPPSDGELVGATPRAEGRHLTRAAAALPSLFERLRDWLPFGSLVVAPTLAAAVYFGTIASDRYVAEAQFVVRSADSGVSVSGLGALLQTTGLDTAQEDAFLVNAYIQSRDALRDLEAGVGFAPRMISDQIDPLSRYPSVLHGETFEELYDYYLTRVSVIADVTNGISTLRVEAFSPEDARAIASGLLEMSEAFVNRLNARAQSDAIETARREVDEAQRRLLENQKAFSELRRRQGLIDPAADSAVQLDLIASLAAERAELEARLGRLRRDAPGSPQIAALVSRIAALERQIAAERSKLVGGESALAGTFGEFESLTLEQRFLSAAMTSAQAGLEQARAEARRKQLYLAQIVVPSAPDYAREPRRLRIVLAVFTSALLIYLILWLLWANAREHKA